MNLEENNNTEIDTVNLEQFIEMIETGEIIEGNAEVTTSHEEQEVVEVYAQTLTDSDIASKIDGYRSSQCCFRVDTAARHLGLTEEQVRSYLKKKYPKAEF